MDSRKCYRNFRFKTRLEASLEPSARGGGRRRLFRTPADPGFELEQIKTFDHPNLCRVAEVRPSDGAPLRSASAEFVAVEFQKKCLVDVRFLVVHHLDRVDRAVT